MNWTGPRQISSEPLACTKHHTSKEAKQWRIALAVNYVDYARVLRDLRRPEEATAKLRAAIEEIRPILEAALNIDGPNRRILTAMSFSRSR